MMMKHRKVHFLGLDNGIATLAWEKSRYINNIKGYEIYVLNYEYELVAEITDPDATTYALGNLRFLFNNEIFLRIVPKKLPLSLPDFELHWLKSNHWLYRR
jgi:hypothetical protein